ncbi:MAG: histidinol-phosphate transaminase [Spirochaetes bacterium RBG_13_51_14]|nr:MAG: histidinol-phosphate transaminase [Spirochaetes bacterium RBG_13_51_14]
MTKSNEEKYWNTRLKNAAEYVPGEQPQGPEGYIKLNTNENPFPPSKAVLEAIRAAANDSLKRYPDPTAHAIRVAYAAAKGLNPDNIFVGNGSDEIFTLILRGFVEPDGVAAFPYPSYALYGTLAQMNGIRYDTVSLSADFSYDMAGFLKKKYDLAIIANPNNPTGTYCEVDDIRSFMRKFKGLLVVDEAYIDFYGGSAADLTDEFSNIIVTHSMSKSYSLAGLRIGFAVAPEDIIRGLMKIKDSYNVNMLAAAGAVAALKDAKGFNYNIKMVVNNKEYLEESLAAMGFDLVPSRANFIFVKHPAITSRELYGKLKERKILVRHFTGPVQSDYVRISVGTMLEIKALAKEIAVIVGA